MGRASETDVDGIPCSCLEECKMTTSYMLIEANVPVLLKISSLQWMANVSFQRAEDESESAHHRKWPS